MRLEGATEEDIREELEAIEAKYTELMHQTEHSVTSQLEAAHAQQQLDLRQAQLAELSSVLSELAPEDILLRHEAEAAAEESKRLAEFQVRPACHGNAFQMLHTLLAPGGNGASSPGAIDSHRKRASAT